MDIAAILFMPRNHANKLSVLFRVESGENRLSGFKKEDIKKNYTILYMYVAQETKFDCNLNVSLP